MDGTDALAFLELARQAPFTTVLIEPSAAAAAGLSIPSVTVIDGV